MFFVPHAVVQRLDFLKALHAYTSTHAPLAETCAVAIDHLLPDLTLVSLEQADALAAWMAL